MVVWRSAAVLHRGKNYLPFMSLLIILSNHVSMRKESTCWNKEAFNEQDVPNKTEELFKTILFMGFTRAKIYIY